MRNPRNDKKDITKGKTKGAYKTREMDEKPEKPDKPQEKVSLFSFLEDKLPVDEPKPYSMGKPPKFINPQYSSDTSAKSNNSNESFHRAPDRNNSKQYQNHKSFSYQKDYHVNDQKTINQVSSSYKQEKTDQYNHQQNKNLLDNKFNNQMKISSNESNQSSSVNKEKKNVEDTTHLLSKMSLNSQFASRSLRQHLNLGVQKQDQSNIFYDHAQPQWNIGDVCLAKYWEDGKVRYC